MTTESIEQRIAKLQQQIDQTGKELDAAQVRKAYPRLTPHMTQFLEKHSLTAAAAKGKLSVKIVDDALACKVMSPADRIAIKLKLQAAGVF